MKTRVSTYFLLLLMFGFTSGVASAQSTTSKAGHVSTSATITAINHSTRVLALKDAHGNFEEFQCGPEITRFDELNVGDTVTFSYHAAVALEPAGPGDDTATSGPEVTRGKGVRPSGAVTDQQKTTVTVTAIDPAAPSVTVRTADGDTMTALIEDRKNLNGLKVNDRIEITLTEALMVTIEPATW